MKTNSLNVKQLLILFICFVAFSFGLKNPSFRPRYKFPYKSAGLSDRQAAAHLLSRFTCGATPGEVDQVVKMGLEKWFDQQLEGNISDDSLSEKLKDYDALMLTNTQIADKFLKPGQILKIAIADGVINKDSVKVDKKEYRDLIAEYMKKKGLRPEQELFRQLINQKILRASYSNNQLNEVLTDFWFNHFNVSITKNDCAQFIPSYERDVIRPNVTRKFGDLLLATAKSPAMLLYLDNFSSSGVNTGIDAQGQGLMKRISQMNSEDSASAKAQLIKKLQNNKRAQGLNENYAREVMELHTLGVDGGYTQNDVTQAAKVLTGWTIYPMGDNGYGNAIKKVLEKIGEDNLAKRGFIHDGDFLFAKNRHDNNTKTVLGKLFPADGGYEEGVQLLNTLAHHTSTAKFISRKLAVRFVSDNPPQSLIDKMAQTFLTKDGDIKEVLITMATAPEFWDKSVIRVKTKSPFELEVSAIRALNADVKQPYQLFTWSDKMGEKMYFYQAPTGFPDNGQYWINTGALLNRMNFGLALASQRIPGIQIDLLALNQHHEPESANAALLTYGQLIMPERDLSQTIKRLTPLLNDPALVKKIDNAAVTSNKSAAMNSMSANSTSDNMLMNDNANELGKQKNGQVQFRKDPVIQYANGNNTMLSQVVGIIIGSPEFQRK
ncbi:MAG: DUF1800 domain-containing protein [Ginsengibacter sp.]